MGWSPVNAVNAYLETVKLCKLDIERNHPCLKKSRELESFELISALAAGMNAQLIVEVSSAPSATTIALAAGMNAQLIVEVSAGMNAQLIVEVSSAPSATTIALAAGMNAQLIVEVSSASSATTIALAAAATGGQLVCILPANAHTLQAESVEAMKQLGLEDTTNFVIGGANELLQNYKYVDFCVIDCKAQEDCSGLFKLLHINPSAAVVVAHNVLDRTTTAFVKKRTTTAAYDSMFKKGSAKSTTLGIGKGLEVTKIGTCNLCSSPTEKGMPIIPERRYIGNQKSRWIVHVDERTGEEHVFLVRKHRNQLDGLYKF